ncbi:MAG: right-handed parallel beta-helix repeat-containing protein [Sedimentisphaerales bacterium]|nr:right-handed parallel beta-helix repeat-containing protein [Sedimentisphaerales bacterium]
MKSRIRRIIHVVSLLVVFACAASQAATYYVSPEGDNTSGLSWVTAFRTIQTAVDKCSPVGNDTVRVRQGTYPITAPIVVTKAIFLYGGYSGEGTARNAAVFVTSIDGGDAAIHCFQVSANATIDGFRITGGSGFGSAPNNAGGGMFIDSCDPVIFNCAFVDNYAELAGGGIFARFAGGSISDCAFVQNSTGDYGGGICLLNCDTSIMDCQFTGNRCLKMTTTCGGAIYNEDSSPTISECIFSGNKANLGASIFNTGSDAGILDCDFAGCDLGSSRGGGIYSYQSSIMVKNGLFHGNHVDVSGAAIYEAEGSSGSFVNCILRNNGAIALGGAIYTDNRSTPVFTNCTIYANNAGSRGGGVYNYFGKPVFTNCIVWENTASMGGAGICDESDTPGMMTVVRYSDVQGTAVYAGTGNILADPKFVYPAGDDLHLQGSSPCVDTGSNSISTIEVEDYEGNPRIVDGNLDGSAVADMGAYEHQLGLRIMDHLAWVYISQGELYDNPGDTTAGYWFVAEMQTDDSVDHIDFLSPAGYAYRITSAPSTSTDNVQTSHQVSGSTHLWQYWARFTDVGALSQYGDGNYLVVLYYKNGTTQQTNVPYTLPGTNNPIPAPTQKPHIVAPGQQAGVGSPVTVAWDACTDTAVTNVFLAIVNSDTGAAVMTDDFSRQATNSSPYDLAEGEYGVELAFEGSYSVTNVDGVLFRYGKVLVMHGQFEVLYATVYRFWSPITSTHFYTINESERVTLINQYSYAWNYEGPAFKACLTDYHPGLSPVYRFWSPYTSCHFYTISESERDMLIRDYSYWWTFEGVAYYAYAEGDEPAGTKPIYRFWSPITSCHFYTMSENEKAYIIREWSGVFMYEGVAFYAYP